MMRKSEVRLEFFEKIDKNGKKYYLAKPRLPVLVDLSKATILIWPEDEDGPTGVVALNDES